MSEANNVAAAPTPASSTLFWIWLRIGLLSFGGPAAQIALMHRFVVVENRWLSEKQYLNALSFCMLLPGPEAMQLATYVGWRLRGSPGGLIAGLLFVTPGAIIIAVLALLYTQYGDLSVVKQLFIGVKAAVIVVVLEALMKVARKALTSALHWAIALFAFIGIFFFNTPFPLIVLGAALCGFLISTTRDTKDALTSAAPNKSMFANTVKTVLTWSLIWATPLVLLAALGEQAFLLQLGTFFSRLAVVTFGGAYAVLAYLGQEVVTDFGWLTAGEMMDALGLAETTPGPLILVTEFVAYIAGFREGGVAMGLAAAALTLWVTFVPCFLWIFAGAPYLEWISAQPRFKGALSAITAAVVGVILNLSLWFALHVLFEEVSRAHWGPIQWWVPDASSINGIVVVLSGLCAVALFKLRWGIARIVLVCAALGWLLSAAS